jgi:hypothetical protein
MIWQCPKALEPALLRWTQNIENKCIMSKNLKLIIVGNVLMTSLEIAKWLF